VTLLMLRFLSLPFRGSILPWGCHDFLIHHRYDLVRFNSRQRSAKKAVGSMAQPARALVAAAATARTLWKTAGLREQAADFGNNDALFAHFTTPGLTGSYHAAC